MRKLNRIYEIDDYSDAYTKIWIVIAKNKIEAIKMIMSEQAFFKLHSKEHIGSIKIIGYTPLKKEILIE